MGLLYRTPARMEDLALFTRHLAGAAATRAPLPGVLRAYALEAEPGPLPRAIGKIASEIELGTPLSDALGEHAGIFPPAYRRLVRLGEQGRALAGVMNQLADSLEEGLKTYEHFRRAAVYPLLVMILLLADLAFLFAHLRPRFVGIFTDLGMEIPGWLPLGGADNYFLFGIGGALLVIIALLLGAALGLRTKGFGYGRFWLNLPLTGPVLRRAETARFAHNLSLLLANRIPLAESLGLLADSSENSYVRGVIEEFQRRFESGERLSDLVGGHPLFPPTMAVMMSQAEDQGALADTMRALGRFYTARTSHGLTVLREVFEPLALLLIGLLIGLLVISFYLPLFQVGRLAG